MRISDWSSDVCSSDRIGDKCVKLPSPCLDGRRGWIAFLDVSVEEGTQCHRSSRSGSVLHLVDPIFIGGECLISDNPWRTDDVLLFPAAGFSPGSATHPAVVAARRRTPTNTPPPLTLDCLQEPTIHLTPQQSHNTKPTFHN